MSIARLSTPLGAIGECLEQREVVGEHCAIAPAGERIGLGEAGQRVGRRRSEVREMRDGAPPREYRGHCVRAERVLLRRLTENDGFPDAEPRRGVVSLFRIKARPALF